MNGRRTIFLLFIPAIALLVYLNSIKGEFIWDDEYLIVRNEDIKDVSNIPKFFVPSYWIERHPGTKGQFRPLRAVTFTLSYAIWGERPEGYRITNVIFHILNCILIYILTLRISGDRSISYLSAIFFAVHPVHAEVVSWVKNLSEIMCLLFILISWWFHHKGEEHAGISAISLKVASIFSFILSLLSKEMGVMFPILLAGWYGISSGMRDWKVNSRRIAPLFLILLIYLFYVLFIIGRRVGPDPGTAMDLNDRILVSLKSLIIYLKLLFFPFILSAEQTLVVPKGFFHPETILSVAVVFLFIFGIIRTAKHSRMVSFSLLWIILSLLPVINIKYIYGRPIANQRLYIPSLGFCWLLAWSIVNLGRWRLLSISKEVMRSLGLTAGGIIISLYGYATIERNWVYVDSVQLYRDNIRKSPTMERPHYNLGTVLKDRGRYDEAIREFREALKVNPYLVEAYNNLGVCLWIKGDKKGAIDAFRSAIMIKPDFDKPIVNLGKLYMDQGSLDMAKEQFERVITLRPDQIQGYLHMGELYLKKDEFPEALSFFEKARAIDPENPEPYYGMAQLHIKKGEYETAFLELRRAALLDRNYINGFIELGSLLISKGLYHLAEKAFIKALEVDPKNTRTIFYLGNLYIQQGNIEKAIETYRKGKGGEERIPELHYNLGNALQIKGNIDEAQKEFMEATILNPGYWEARFKIGKIYLERDRIYDAIDQFKEILKIKPESVEAHLQLGAIYLNRLDNGQMALYHFKKALEIDPKNPNAPGIEKVVRELEKAMGK
jgi:tetratricopeptide (TPR) repeat protein